MTEPAEEAARTGATGAATGVAAPARPVLEMRDVRKRFGSTQALDGVSMSLYAGEIHALLGENGAGKTGSRCSSPPRRTASAWASPRSTRSR